MTHASKIALGTLFAAALVACADILGFDRLKEVPSPVPSPEASILDAGAEAGEPAACKDLGVVPRRPEAGVPEASAAPGENTYVLAVSEFDFGAQGDAAARPVGFNLDQRCTFSREQSSCQTRTPETSFERYVRDKLVGDVPSMDNAGFSIMEVLGQRYDRLSPSAIQQRLSAGEFGLVIRLANYNGTPDDDQVTVTVQPALGIAASGGGLPPSGVIKPTFTSSDVWVPDGRFYSVNDAQYPNFVSITGYVVDGTLVVDLRQFTAAITVSGSESRPLDLALSEAWIQAKLRVNGSEARLEDGVIGGRWQAARALAAIGEIRFENSIPVCKLGSIFDAVKADLCAAPDLTASSGDPSTAPCAAISAGLRFTAVPAHPDTFTVSPQQRNYAADQCSGLACPE
jgi:hypothetical protein